MARNGSGSYSLPVNSWNPALNNTPATAADYQALINDIAQALTQSVSRDGQSIMTGNLPMGGNRLTGLGPATATGDSLRFEQLFSQGLQADLASAATTDIGSVLTTVVNITGTATITSFGANYNGPRYVRFAGACTLTNSASLVLPGGANITTAAGDSAIVVPLGNPATGWRVFAYQRASGVVLDGSVTTAAIQDDAVTFPKLQNIGTATLLGRSTAGTGDVEALTGAQATSIIAGAIGQLAGFRNLLINGNFQINQRAYVSGTNVGAANTYTLDRWRVVTSGQSLTFTASGNGNSMTAPAGGVEQVIEGANIGGGTYVLNWTGTATATVNGTARAKGEAFTLPTNNNATVRLIGGTVSLVQLEPGTVPTPFEHRPVGVELALCQRYYFQALTQVYTGANPQTYCFKSTMRAVPTVSGGGAGFSTTTLSEQSVVISQTATGSQTLTFSAEL